MIGAHHAWATSETNGKERTESLRKTYPGELLRALFFEVSQKEADSSTNANPMSVQLPVWKRDGERVGGYGKLDQIVEASTGYQKLNALMAGMATGTCKAYLRGWPNMVHYCTLRGIEPWVTVGGPGWGGALLHFIMFEHAVLGLRPSTTTGTICAIRYFHVIHGRSDFTAAGVRYKHLLKSHNERFPSCQKLPYKIDLSTWVRESFLWGAPDSPRIKEIRAGVNLGFAFLLRARKIKQMRQKDVEIGLGAESGSSSSLYIGLRRTRSNEAAFELWLEHVPTSARYDQ